MYFYFSGRLIAGGNWARMSGRCRLLYLGLATRAKTYTAPPDEGYLRWQLPEGVPLDDLQQSYEASGTPGSRFLRLAVDVSSSELSKITGAASTTLKSASGELKHPRVWPGAPSDRSILRHSPLAVYPGAGGVLIYHFRDHAEPWPWDLLNVAKARPRPTRAPVTLEEAWGCQ